MKFLVIRHIDFIKLISKVKNDKSKFMDLIANASNSEINALSELVNNVIKGRLPCSPYRKKMLKKYVSDLRLIGDKSRNVQHRRRRLALKGGYFLPSLIPLVISALGAIL